MKRIYEEPRMTVARIDVAEQLTVSQTFILCGVGSCRFHDDVSTYTGG